MVVIRTRTIRKAAGLAAMGLSLVLAGCVSSNYAPVVYHDSDPVRPGETFASAGDPSLKPVPLGGVQTVPLGLTAESLPAPVSRTAENDMYARPLDVASLPRRAPLEARVKPYSVVVQPGDTLYSLSRQHTVGRDAIIEANNLRAPYSLRVGQTIAIPGEKSYTVRPGETLYSIARENRVEVRSLAMMNDLNEPYTIKIGQVLRMPGASEYGTMAAARAADGVGGPLIKMGESQDPLAEKRQARAARPPGADGPGFMWPVKGRLISTYGPSAGGRRNDGINIAAAPGSPVYASKDGVVIYVGNELRGYGNLVLIRHDKGYVTAYAHNDRLLVERGDSVKKGQHIADAGRSGGVSESQVHFEIRKDRQPVDPMGYLPRT